MLFALASAPTQCRLIRESKRTSSRQGANQLWPDCKVIHDTNLKPYDYQNAPAREPEINEMGCQVSLGTGHVASNFQFLSMGQKVFVSSTFVDDSMLCNIAN